MVGHISRVTASRILHNRRRIAREWYRVQFCQQIHNLFPNPYAEEASEEEAIDSHLVPMLGLLAEWFRSGNVVFRDLYMAERRRFAPHRDGVDVLTEYFKVLAPLQESILKEVLGHEASSAVRSLHAMEEVVCNQRINLLVLGDCLMSDVLAFLSPWAQREGIRLDSRYYYFSAAMGVDLLEEGVRTAIRSGVDAVAASYLSYSGIPPYRLLLESADRGEAGQVATLVDSIAEFIRRHLHAIRTLTDAPVLLHNAAGLPIGRWRRVLPFVPPVTYGRRFALAQLNAQVGKIVDDIDNCFLVDETKIVEQHGHRGSSRSLLPRRVRKNSQMHPEAFSHWIAGEYHAILKDVARFRKAKLILVDFDNTLWEGVMAEGQVKQFEQRQRLLKRLQEEGVLLAAVSKNSASNIRWDEMVLTPEDFVSLKISWDLKTRAIREVATELNLGLDSFVFLDDSAAEREMVRSEMPEIICLDSTEEETWVALGRLLKMPNTRRTEEARRRTAMYQEQAQRDREVNRQDTDMPSLMKQLKLRATVGDASEKDVDRLVELFQRTNQFNTTSIRYSRGDVEAMVLGRGMLSHEKKRILVGRLSDKFGDLGIVCAAVTIETPSTLVIECFVMSCRAMGFGMEQVMLSQVIRRSGTRHTVGLFVPSSRNQPASTLYECSGFRKSEDGSWAAETGHEISPPSWIDLES